jgi:hypothetical protein
MLVIPALISLKSSVVDKCSSEILELIQVVVRKLKDSTEIVAKTARKLLIEINKCYPLQFENLIIPSLKTDEEKQICRAVLKMDEDEI